jgi:hypothetical protein
MGIRDMAAIGARIAIRFSCVDPDANRADKIIRHLSKHCGVDVKPGRPAGRLAPAKLFSFGARSAYVITQCNSLLASIDRHAKQIADEEGLKEIRARLFDCIETAVCHFELPEDEPHVARALLADVDNAVLFGSANPPHSKPLNPSDRGPLGAYWPFGEPDWWNAEQALLP